MYLLDPFIQTHFVTDAVFFAVRRVLAEVAVNMHINKTGCNISALGVNNISSFGYTAEGDNAFNNIRITKWVTIPSRPRTISIG